MMNQFDNVLKFRGTWRLYQKRVLDNFDQHKADEKIHIVAAPGSGKTTVGIEMIRQLGANCLILTPSITIREQWLARIQDAFLCETVQAKTYLSNSLVDYKPITAITYQALHSMYTKQASDDALDAIDVVAYLKAQHVKVICLDEAHHMRNEWVKVLEKILGQLEGIRLISLTATPPYDANPNEWKRYIDLCGPIDEEIFTPELVKEESLCPHQDYVYFNWPTKEEKLAIKEYKEQVLLCQQELMDSKQLYDLVSSHQVVKNPKECLDQLLEQPAYLYALMMYMQEKQIVYPSQLNQVLSVKKGNLPTLSVKHLEILMQGILYDDTDRFVNKNNEIEALRQILKKYGCIQRKQVKMITNERIDKLLINSKGKLESIKTIALAEYDNMKENLRMLILCDFIKKEALDLLGTGKMSQSVGTITIFETLRSQSVQMKLAVLSGTVIILPLSVVTSICERLHELGYTSQTVKLPVDDYVLLESNAESGILVKQVTLAFENGQIQALIGTKALLGEGWDSPSINSLILASFVGSFVLSNQMRGRAIRKSISDPNKVSNIWHLVCIEPKMNKQDILYDPFHSIDLQTLKRRFKTFLGVHYTKPVIESGFARLSYIQDVGDTLDEKTVAKINKQMLEAARKRKELHERWNEALVCVNQQVPIEDVVELDVELLKKNYVFTNYWMFVMCMVITTIAIQAAQRLFYQTMPVTPFTAIGILLVAIVLIFLLDWGLSRLFAYVTPQHTVKKVGQAMLAALEELNLVSHESKYVRVKNVQAASTMMVYLEGGSAKDKHLFSTCMEEYFALVENQRYIIVRKGRKNALNKYFVVPEVFAKRKQDAEIFLHQVKRMLGRCDLVYTRSANGRKVLLKARGKCFAYANQKMIDSKLKVLGKFE